MAKIVSTIIRKITKDEKATVISILVTDNETFKRMEDVRMEVFRLEEFKTRVRAIRDSGIVSEDAEKVLSLGEFDPTATPPPPLPPPPDPTPIQLFSIEVQTFRQMQRAVDLKLMQNTDKAYTDQQALIQKDFVFPDYLGVL